MATLDPWGSVDPLGRALHFLRMDGAFYCHSELSDPWGMSLPPMPGYLWFHVVASGTILLETEAEAPDRLEAGEMALVPHGNGHILRSEPGVPAPDILSLERRQVSDRYEILEHGGGGRPTSLICGAVRLEHPSARRLIQALPAALLIGSGAAESAWIQSTVQLLGAEARQLRPGGEAVITRLADVIVIQAIRAWIETDPSARTGWLGALRDPQIGRAIALIHSDPSHAWTVEALAGEVAMSRSSFAARFTNLVGEPAMRYLAGWRMQLALAALQGGRTTVAAQADALGYRSEAAFARAFKRVIGESPGAARRRQALLAGTAPHG